MAELARQTNASLNIATEAEVLSFTYSGTPPIEVIARIDLGASNPIVGNGTYYNRVYINSTLVHPQDTLTVASGVTKAIFLSSRNIPLYTGDVVSLRVLGLGGDTAVSTLATLRDATPAKASDIFGSGARMIDHNYGGTNTLAYVLNSAGVINACIYAYLTSDYTAGNRANNYIQARSTTTVGGTWLTPMMLSPASYTLVFFKQGTSGPDTVVVVVT